MSVRPEQPRSSSVELSTVREVSVQREQVGAIETVTDYVAEERPVALHYYRLPYVVMLASPADLEDLGVGFTLSEGIVDAADEIRGVELVRDGEDLAVHLNITGERLSRILQRQRNLTGRTGCGLCGVESVEEAIRHPAPVREGVHVTSAEIHAALARLHSQQPLNLKTGSVHAAAWALPGKGIQLVREDVGRHNALDKVIGALTRAGTDLSTGYLIITSRASYEMVQKAATVGVSLIVAVSAPTALAIDLAVKANVTLVGFARADRHVVYAHPQRLQD
ncbi:MAG TPA: formate dehydrogenase accessory sulfurtransferase FdhD [Steroidobacteraceae bacterium]|nr:formate dehydrogenase accessory sulfurtransferase FdhD [Steroidobacteraceae bacterium]